MMPRSQALPEEPAEQIGPGGSCGWCKQPYFWAEGAWWCPTQACRMLQMDFAVAAVADKSGQQRRWLYVPTSIGVDFHRSPAKNRMLGGAAGGAKSHILRWDMLRKALRVKGYEGLIVRRTYGELEKSQLRRLAREVPLLGGVYHESKYLAEFPQTGALIEAGHLDDKTALSRWLSTEYDDIKGDEGSTFDPQFLLELSTRARTSKPSVKAAGGARFDVGTNPGGPAWPTLLDLFVTHEPDFEMFPALKKIYKPEKWHYIKALLDDNPYRDEDYEESLAVLGETRYEQLRWGSEFVTDGQFFGEFRARKDGQPYHERTIEIPAGIEWSCGMDWGHNAPGWIGFIAHLADGHYHLKAEYKFRGKIAEEVAKKFHEIRQSLGVKEIRYVVGDPAMWAKTGSGKGEAIAETLRRCGLTMRKGDNDRFNGWQRCHEMLRADADGTPFFTADPGCRYFHRSIPALVQDPNDADDLDTSKDDHAADGWRYWAMSRPRPTMFVSDTSLTPGSIAWWKKYPTGKVQQTGVLA